MKSIAIIPARGGSRGVPRKNMAPCGGRPLLYWTMLAAQASSVDEVYVSSEDDEIRGYVAAAFLPKVQPLERPGVLAEDKTLSSTVLEYHLAEREWDVGLMLQPTSPLREGTHINEALALLEISGADCVVSVVADAPLIWMGDVTAPEPTFNTDLRPRRQDITGIWRENGAIFVFRREAWDLTRNQVCGRVVLYRMGEDQKIDVDTTLDLLLADVMLKGRARGRVATVPAEDGNGQGNGGGGDRS
jgi:CMP-N,N'-diacetyllegionaminic acid synthase